MTELTKQELNKVKGRLDSLKIWYIVAIVLCVIIILTSVILTVLAPIIVGFGFNIEEPLPIIGSFLGMLLIIFLSIVLMILYIISLVGLSLRKPFAYPVGMAALIMGMFWTPIGTIVNAIFLAKLNNPIVKKYLNYGS